MTSNDEATSKMWFWKTDEDSWELFGDEDSDALESAVQRGDTSVILMDSFTGTPKYECFLTQVPMRQENLQTQHSREICRGWPEVDSARQHAPQQHGSGVNIVISNPFPESDNESSEGTNEEEDSDDDSDDDDKNELPDNVQKIMEEISSDPPELANSAPPSFICSLACGIMRHPAMTLVGSTYEKVMIQQWLRDHDTDPLTNQHLSDTRLIDNWALKDSIESWRQQHQQQSRNCQREGKKAPEEDSKQAAKTVKEGGQKKSEEMNDYTANSGAQHENEINGEDDDLAEGEERQVSSYTVKLIGGVYSCSCPAWRYKGGAIDARSCKHLAQVRGAEREAQRMRSVFQNSNVNGKKRRRKDITSLEGKSICFTGALQTMTRAKAHALAQECGAVVHQSVTRNTDILVVGRRPGMKLSKGDESNHCEIWEEEDFIDATESNSVTGTPSVSVSASIEEANTRSSSGAQMQDASVPAKIMLAHSYKFDNSRVDPTGWLMSEKLDGMRAWWDGHKRRLWSRQGKPIHAPAWWLESLPSGITLDGELWLGRGKFQECMSIVRRQDGPQTWNQVTFVVFDAPESATGYEERYSKAKEALEEADASTSQQQYAWLHPYAICNGKEHVKSKLDEIEEQGGEGLMLRKPGSEYKGGRSNDLLKVKSARDDEAIVNSHETGRGRHGGRLGAVHVTNRAGKSFKVGSGFTDAERENPPPVGSVITYRYNELTNGGTPRFPVFVRIRPDVSAADIQAADSS
mmetsp:Transcript_29106/g.38676  ORF Transcript_29106/g.38676 Transcript_29106/m.38676 type:complete len:748 (-) Transcript_29106:401-2644(-)